MDEKSKKQMEKMVNALQPHCDEPISAAMTCSHAGSMKSVLVSSFLGGLWGSRIKSVKLPNPVFIAAGTKSIYAFDYAPRGFNFKIKKLAARWSKDEITVETTNTGAMAKLTISTNAGETYELEIPTMMGAREVVDMFFTALGPSHT